MLSLLLSACLYAHADHITGGEIYYTYTSLGNNQYRYDITVKLFMDCHSPRQFNNPATISIFNRGNYTRIRDESVNLDSDDLIQLNNTNPCITDPPDVCYRIGLYEFSTILPGNLEGYVITAQINFRIYTLTNLTPGYGNVGATYSAEIPGTLSAPNGPANASAKFTGSDLVVVCADNMMNYSFAATDPDGDELRYSFCNAWQTTTGSRGGSNVYPAPPPYVSVPYGNGFDATVPLGAKVSINPTTGMITGIAPGSGTYVITVCVEEIRNGKVIARQRKDLQIKITACTIAAAALPNSYMLCRNSMRIDLANLSQSPLIRTFYWEIKDNSDLVVFSSTAPNPSHTFTTAGTYTVKLVINRGDQCADSITSPAYVYPGMVPQFSAAGICINKPTQFTNTSTTVYGTLTDWLWEFGDPEGGTNSSALQNPEHTYITLGPKQVKLIVYNNNGCIDTALRTVTIIDKPPITLAFRDTLICIPDNLQLRAAGSGNFSWTPNQRISGAATATPTVDPQSTTKYYVSLNDNGCINTDSVLVRVVDHVTLNMMPDTTICQGDTIRLRLSSDALRYSWGPSPQVLDPAIGFPRVVTASNTRYQVVANIGSCQATGFIHVNPVPYPLVNAGPDVTICYQATTRLSGSSDGNRVVWLPSGQLSDGGSLAPIAKPPVSTSYVLAAYDNKGCPKPSFDTVLVTVLPKIIPFAGNDTAVIVSQPLQLKATGGVKYQWSPGTGLSSTAVADPLAIYNTASPGIRYKVLVYDAANCVDSAYLLVKVFNTKPSIFVPNAFTPNNDGNNDRFRFVAAGIKSVEFFRVYNRWGQLVYSNPTGNPGWDGTLGGKLQDPGTYVWVIRAIDITGAIYTSKGQMILIR